MKKKARRNRKGCGLCTPHKRQGNSQQAIKPSIKRRLQGKPGSRWRVLAWEDSRTQEEIALENRGIFDELVVDDWFHIEQMDRNTWWMRIGNARLHGGKELVVWVRIPKTGTKPASLTYWEE